MSVLDRVVSIRAEALPDEAIEQLHRQTSAYQHERALMGEAALRVSYWIGGAGLVVGVLGMACAATLFPLKTHDIEYYVVNQVTGYTGPAVGVKDAPSLFSDVVAQADVLKYVMARENYTYETDDLAFHQATIMSSGDEQRHFKEMHDAAGSPAKALGDHGYVRVENVQMWKLGDGKRQTQEYVVKFTRKVIRAGQPVPGTGEPITAQISFQFHPEYVMEPNDRRLNPTGFQAIEYRSRADVGRTN